jgi:hypothetical protein
MKIMAKQATNKVSTIKLPDGQYTETRKETLKELFTVYLLSSMLTDDSNYKQGQQNLDVSRSTKNREEWNLARNVINESKIRWALRTSQPFKSAGTDEILWALLQQGMEQPVPYLCCIFRAFLVYGYIGNR